MLCSPIQARADHRFPAARTYALAVALPIALFAQTANADLPSPFLSGALEVWSGGEMTRSTRGAWAGMNWAPLGKIEDPGFRVRFAGGSGQYRTDDKQTGQNLSIYGTSAFADLLVGYQWSLGATTLKLFAGGTFNGQLQVASTDAYPEIATATGAKMVAEGWINITPQTFAQIDVSAATAHRSYTSRVRLGYRLTRSLALGVEAGAIGSDNSDTLRAGLFGRYEWLGGEISASGGFATDDNAARRTPYGGLVYLTRY